MSEALAPIVGDILLRYVCTLYNTPGCALQLKIYLRINLVGIESSIAGTLSKSKVN